MFAALWWISLKRVTYKQEIKLLLKLVCTKYTPKHNTTQKGLNPCAASAPRSWAECHNANSTPADKDTLLGACFKCQIPDDPSMG